MRQVTFYEVIRDVLDDSWDRIEWQILWTSDPMKSDRFTGNTRIEEMPE